MTVMLLLLLLLLAVVICKVGLHNHQIRLTDVFEFDLFIREANARKSGGKPECLCHSIVSSYQVVVITPRQHHLVLTRLMNEMEKRILWLKESLIRMMMMRKLN